MADVKTDENESLDVLISNKEAAEPEVVDDDSSKSENGESKPENGSSEDKLENGDSKDGDSKDGENGDEEKAVSADLCSNKRKSTAGDGQEAPAEGVSPEKKAKLDEKSAEAESNGEAEVAA